MASRSRDQSSTENPARPAPTASRAVSATPSGSSANPFSRSADTGTSLADAIWAAWVIASSRVTEPSRRPSDAAKPLLVVARASKPSARKGAGGADIPRVGDEQRGARPVQLQKAGRERGLVGTGHGAATIP